MTVDLLNIVKPIKGHLPILSLVFEPFKIRAGIVFSNFAEPPLGLSYIVNATKSGVVRKHALDTRTTNEQRIALLPISM